MSQREMILWSGLIQQEWRKEFHCPDELEVTDKEFTAALRQELQANHIPAECATYIVNWDGTGRRQTRTLLRYTGEDAETDIVRCLVGLDRMGNYTYVEVKTYFPPPELPVSPRDTKEVPKDSTVLFVFVLFGGVLSVLIGEGTGVCGTIGLIALSAGLLGLFSEANKRDARRSAIEWNELADKEARAREEAWDDWQSQILTSAYLAKTDDTLGRFVQAVKSTVDRVTQTLFIDHNAELRKESENERTRKEIEQEMRKRREEAFG